MKVIDGKQIGQINQAYAYSMHSFIKYIAFLITINKTNKLLKNVNKVIFIKLNIK